MMMDMVGSIGHALWDAVLPSLATVVAGLLIVILKRVAAKYGIEVTEKQEERLTQIVVDKIHATEEAARRTQLTGKEKQALTVNAALVEAIDDPSIPNPTLEQVSAKVDAELGKKRAGYVPNAGLPGLGKR